MPLLLAALAPVVGGVAGGLIEKEIAGSGIRDWKGKPWWHGGKVYTLEKKGAGMFLNPWPGPPFGGSIKKKLYTLEKHGSGMILKPYGY